MGDPHYNTWGGKNNSWGNRNKKKKSDGSNSVQNGHPVFNKIVGGICLFALGVAGLDIVSDVILGVKDAVSNTKEVVEHVTANRDVKDATIYNNGTISYDFDIEDELELEAEDIKDILDFLTEQLNVGEPAGEAVVIIDKSAVENDDTYKEQILSRLNNYDRDVTFVIVYTDLPTKEDAESELYRVNEIKIRNANVENNAIFKRVGLALKRNTPNPGECILMLTFMTE